MGHQTIPNALCALKQMTKCRAATFFRFISAKAMAMFSSAAAD